MNEPQPEVQVTETGLPPVHYCDLQPRRIFRGGEYPRGGAYCMVKKIRTRQGGQKGGLIGL